MPFIPANPIMEVRIHYLANDQKCMNVLHYATRDSVAGVEAANLTLSFLNLFDGGGAGSVIAAMRTMQSGGVAINRITAQIIWTTRFLGQWKVVNYVGSKAGSCENQNTQATIQKYGTLGNRHNLGSFHLGGLPISTFASGNITAAAKIELDLLADALLDTQSDGITAAEWIPVILNKEKYQEGGKDKWRIIGWSDLYGTESKTTARVMYRRTKGVGD